jgi:hypothetical protein
VLVQDRPTVCSEHTIGIAIISDALDGTPADDAQLEARFGTFGDSATLDARLVHGLRRTYHRLRNGIVSTRWNSYETWVMWNLLSICFETVLASVNDRCSVCARRSTGS